MILTAQRVVTPSGGKTGINTYWYAHAPGAPVASFDSHDIPRGELLGKAIAVRPPGNRVRSFLDIVAPDDAAPEELGKAFEAFIAAHAKQDFPWSGRQDRCAFNVGMEDSLASTWRKELADLLRALASLLEAADEQGSSTTP